VSEIRSSSWRLGQAARKASYPALACARCCAAVLVAVVTFFPAGDLRAGDLRTPRCLLPVGKCAEHRGTGSRSAPPQLTHERQNHEHALHDAPRRHREPGHHHIDTGDAYGPRITNQLIREALHPYPGPPHIATKVGATRDAQGGWPTARRPADIRRQVQENLDSLGLDVLDLVNLRLGDAEGPVPGSLAEPFGTLVELQRQGLVRHLGVSNATADQVTEARSIAPVVCVQNRYDLAHRTDDGLIDTLVDAGIAYVPFFPLGGFTPLQSAALAAVATRLSTTPWRSRWPGCCSGRRTSC